METSRVKEGVKASFVSIIGNILLSAVKIICGLIGKSSAVIADGIHSLSDVFTSAGVIVGLKLSSKKEDKEHPYGHERIESLVSLCLGIILFAVAIGIGWTGIESIISKNFSIPSNLAIAAAVLSIVSKEGMYQYTVKIAEKIKSTSLKADAWHHRSDAFSSIGALIGIIGARMGFPIMDSVAAIIICVIIVKVSYDISKQAVNELIDASASDEIVKNMELVIKSVAGVKRIDMLKTRLHGNKIFVDVEISVDADLSLKESHEIAARIHHEIEKNENVKHCTTHVNPYTERNK